MSRRSFYCLLVASLGLMSFMAGLLRGSGDNSMAIMPTPRPLSALENSHSEPEIDFRGPARALKDKPLQASPATKAPEPEKAVKVTKAPVKASPKKSAVPRVDLSAAAANEVQSVLQADVHKSPEAAKAARKKARQRLLAMHRLPPVPGQGGRPRATSLFSFADLNKRTELENPLLFALNHMKGRLQSELGDPHKDVSSWPDITTRALSDFDPAKAAVNPLVINAPELKVGSLVPPENARHILIATTWRSGSSFFGDLLNHYAGSFYSFEPLHYTFSGGKKSANNTERARTLLKSLFTCHSHPEVDGYLMHATRQASAFLFDDNFRYWHTCQRLLPGRAACYLPKLYSKACALHPIRTIKTVRLRVEETEPLILDSQLPNLKVVVLLRDPRGTMNSRASMDWCKRATCAEADTVCQHLKMDTEAAYQLREKYPDKYHLVRYEDLSCDPYSVVDDLLKFLELPASPQVDTFIKTHTKMDRSKSVYNPKLGDNVKKQNPYGTYRDSKVTAFAWRAKMDINYILKIQESCKSPMEQLGYNLFNSTAERDDPENPTVIKTKEEVWPWR